MSLSLNNLFRQARTGLLLLIACTVLLGIVYPVAVYAVGRIASAKADGSVVSVDGTPVGSSLIGQTFNADEGGEEWFWSRPSAAGDGYDPLSSSATNLGPEDTSLLEAVEAQRELVAAADGTDPAAVASDALTSSGSGLDPDISPEYAQQQIARVAAARGLSEDAVAALVAEHTSDRDLGFIGESHVNVLELNIALSQLG